MYFHFRILNICHSLGNTPWAQPEFAVVDEIPDSTVCANLKDLRLWERELSLQSIHCPSLQNFVLFHLVHLINDFFTNKLNLGHANAMVRLIT